MPRKQRVTIVRYRVVSTLAVKGANGETKGEYVILREISANPDYSEPCAIPAEIWETTPPVGSVIEVERFTWQH